MHAIQSPNFTQLSSLSMEKGVVYFNFITAHLIDSLSSVYFKRRTVYIFFLNRGVCLDSSPFVGVVNDLGQSTGQSTRSDRRVCVVSTLLADLGYLAIW